MKSVKSILFVSSIAFISACGGGGGGGGAAPTPATVAAAPEDSLEKLVFSFQPDPLEPKVFNLAANQGDPKNHFSPGESISLTWNTGAFFSKDDGATASSGIKKSYVYDVLTVLSADDTLQLDQDLLLFDWNCSIPGSSTDACTSAASVRCVYAENNNNTLSCTSYPLGKAEGLLDVTVDTTSFLDTIPKAANIIVQVCLREEPKLCDVASMPLQLN